MLSKHEKQEQKTLYTATQSLNIEYKFKYCMVEDATITVDGANNHSLLYAGCDGLFALRKELYSSKIDDINFANATVTLLYTDTNTDEGYLGEQIEQKTFFISSDKRDCILSSQDFYTQDTRYSQQDVTENKSTRDRLFNSLLTNRVRSFSEIVKLYDLPINTISSVEALNTNISGSMFHETFHHSEQGLMHYLSSQSGIQSLVQMATVSKAVYLYGIVLDIYTQRMLCKNCNAGLLGMQNSNEYGFLFDLSQSV